MNIRFDPRTPNTTIRNGKNRPPLNCGMWIAECGLKKKTPKSEIRNSKSEIQWADVFFAQKALVPGSAFFTHESWKTPCFYF